MAECLELMACKEVSLNDNQWPSRFAYPLLARCKKSSLANMSRNPTRFLAHSKESVISMIILNTKSCEKIIRKIDVQELTSFMRLVHLDHPSGPLHHSEIRLACLTFLVQFHLMNLPKQLIPEELCLRMEERKKKRTLEGRTEWPIKMKRRT